MDEYERSRAAAKFLLDNEQLTVLLTALKKDALNTLTQGDLSDAKNNLRNYRAVEVLEASIKVMADG